MKTLPLFGTILVLASTASPMAMAADSSILFRHHFLGSENVAREQGGTRAKELWRLPESDALLETAISKLAATPARVWPERLSASAEQVAGWVSPLLEDLLRAESYSEISGPTNKAEVALAVRLAPERAGLWSTNLWQLAHLGVGTTPRPVQAAGFKGWEAETQVGGAIQVLHNEQWLVVGVGHRPLEAVSRMLRQVARGGEKDPAWLELEADLTGLGFWLRVFRSEQWPSVRLTVRGDSDNLRTSGLFTFRKPIPWTFEPWRIPTNSIVEPIVSFTVGQGIGPLLQTIFGDTLGLAKLPNQFCLWGQPMQQRQAVVTFPVREATNAVLQLAKSMPEALSKLIGKPVEDFFYISNRTMLAWQFLAPPPFPYLIPWEEGDQEYLLAALLPVVRETNPPPNELFGQLGSRQNLVYYDWELTEDRALFAAQVYQLFAIKHRRDPNPPTDPPQQWLRAIRPRLGNSVTEITRSGARELSLDRKSHLGLTGFELVSLVEWLNSAGFPLDFKLPPPVPSQEESPAAPPIGGR